MALTKIPIPIPIPIPIIFQSVTELFKSRYKDNDTYKAIALIRHGVGGGHPFGSDDRIAMARKTRRIQNYRTVLYPRY